jgi:eukaryotic-like serine/threonine-protein kinase
LSLPADDRSAGPLSDLDGALRAVVAADHLAMSEALEGNEVLLHRRLKVFYGYFATLVVVSWIASVSSDPPAGWEPGPTSLILRIEGVLAFILAAVFVALKLWVPSGRLLRVIDAGATFATALAGGAAVAHVPHALSIDVSAVAFFILFFTLRAALVPSRPWQATLVTALCAVPITVGIAIMYRRAGPPFVIDAPAATSTVIANFLAVIGGVFIVSKTFYGLRSVVERAVQLGQYIVHEKIGEGGMGTVYRASHAMLKRPTAIKLIAPDRDSGNASARFEREVMAASRLVHPNNVAIYDFGRTRGGVFYYAMELLDGQDLARLVEREGPQSERRTVHILLQLAAALAEAHAAGLVHRDIKPENVMLCTRGTVRDFVKVLDFGLVKDAAADVKLTNDRALAGTPLYMAPESILRPDTVGPAADSYGLGCVAFFLLTGKPPFPGDNLVQVCADHIHRAPAAPSARAHGRISSTLDALVLRCLAKTPDERPGMTDIGELLAQAADQNRAGLGAA